MIKNNLLTGSVFKTLIAFTLPVMFAMILQVMYSTVDMLIVGNFSTVADVSAVSTGSQLINTLISLCTGLATGTTILIGQNIGGGKTEKNNIIIGNSVVIFLLVSIVVTVILLFFNKQTVELLNTPSEAVQETSSYLFFCSMGIPMIFLYNILSSIFRGWGDSKTALITVAIACAINIIGDLILVGLFDMGAVGAAIATTTAQSISVVLSIIIAVKKKLFKLTSSMFKLRVNYIKSILYLGLPIALQSVLVSLSFLAITVIINHFGLVYSAAVGLVEKLIGLVMLVPISFMQSISVFVAQNYGAGQHERARTGTMLSIVISLTFCLFTGYLSFFHGDILLRIFSSDNEVITTAQSYLKAYSLDTLLVPFMFSITGYFNGYGRSMFVMFQGVFGAIAIRITFVYIFSLITPTSLFIVGLATPLATFIQILMCIVYYIHLKKQNTFS